jgi:hypothetical protein
VPALPPGPPAEAPGGGPVDARLWSGRARLVGDRRRVRLEIAEVGRFAVADGAEVTVEPAPGGDPGGLTNVLYGAVTALLLAQRGQFALHASTVAIGPAGVALAGLSGAGKSTTALALERRGHPLVADDVSPVRRPVPAAAAPEVVPFGRPWHIWPDTAAALGVDLTGSQLVDARYAKLALPARARRPVPLHAVIVLRPDPDATRIEPARLTGLAAVPVLLDNVYRCRMLARLWATDLFAWAAELSRLLAVWVVARPPGQWSVEAVADAVEAVGTGRLRCPAAAP